MDSFLGLTQRLMASLEGARGLLLVENCQWPFVLDTMRALHPDLDGWPAVREIEMGLSPAAGGRAMAWVNRQDSPSPGRLCSLMPR